MHTFGLLGGKEWHFVSYSVCLAMLTTDISMSFEMKKQTVAAFLDIK
jgi:hypothetical protein